MDSYNRGYNVRVADLGGVGTRSGNTTIVSQSDTVANTPDVNAGFYAVAYDTSAVSGFSTGERTISYRGTDSVFGSGTIGSEIWNAYGWERAVQVVSKLN